MVKFYNSLMFRLTLAFILLILIITGATYAYTYNEARKALVSTIQGQLLQLSGIAANSLTSDQIAFLGSAQAGDEKNIEFDRINSILFNLRKDDKDICEFYIMRKDGDKIVFVADDWFVDPAHANAEDFEDLPSDIGNEYSDYESALLEAFGGKHIVSEDFYTDSWGTFLTGYIPLLDQNSQVAAVLAVDMNVSAVQGKINFIGQLVYYIIGLGIIVAGLIIFYFSRTIVKDLNSITKVAGKLTKGELDFEMPEIKSKNEIYLLNEGIKSLMAAIAFLTDQAKK